MEDLLLSALKKNTLSVPTADLAGRILRGVRAAKRSELKQRLVGTYIGLWASLGAFLSVSFIYGKALIESEFWQLFSLLFSDITHISNFLGNFLVSLLETFPVVPVTLFLLPIFTLLFFLVSHVAYQKPARV